jgi:hypothetical protein
LFADRAFVTFTLSPPVRYAAILGLVAALVLGGGMMAMGRGGSAEAVPASLEPLPLLKKAKPAAPVAAKPKPVATPAPVKKAPQRPSAMVAALKAGLPTPLAAALARHDVVVVSLYNPYSQVDGISFAEARAGAQLAGAGFVPLSVLSQAQVGKLTEQLGLLPNPGVLVYVRPHTLAAKISGFADKETVAQATQNAANGT